MSTRMPATPTRNTLIDTLRGAALIGVFVAHMFAQYEIYWAAPHETLIHKLVVTFVMGKAVSLLTMCFGLSFFILMDRAARRGDTFSGRFAWRMTVLALIGALHSLIYRGDILVILAPLGLLLIPFYRASNPTLLGVALLMLIQPWQIAKILIAAGGADWANQPLQFWNDAGPMLYRTASFLEVVRWNLVEGAAIKAEFFLETGRIFTIFGLFLFGLFLGRSGFLETPERFRRGRRLLLAGLAATVFALHLGQGALAYGLPDAVRAPMARLLAHTLLSEWFNVAVMGIYVLVAIEAYLAGGAAILNRLAPMGRMTLSLYIMQSLIWVPVFYGFGLGAWKALPQGLALILAAGFLTLQATFAHLWFRDFHYGPLEWVWRAATYRTWRVPFVRRAGPDAI